MADLKSSSRSGSKANLNEAAIPLLHEEEEVKHEKSETPEKDAIELKEKASSESEKDDSSPEKTEATEKSESEDKQAKKEKEKKEKEEKKKKEKEEKKKEEEEKKKKEEEKKKNEEEKKKEKEEKKKKEKEEKEEKREKCRQRTQNVVQNLTVGLNLLDRDEKHVNDAVNLNFEDVLAEPDAAHGFDAIWRTSYVLFTGTRYWMYRILAVLLAVPLAIVWGVVFSLLTFFSVWLATPLLRILEVTLFYVRRVWSALVHTTVEPIAAGAGALLANIRVTHHNTATATHVV